MKAITKQNPIFLVICGPTASGKTDLALSIAQNLIDSSLSARSSPRSFLVGNPARRLLIGPCLQQSSPSIIVNILSADSRQIYKGLDIVTGKDIPPELPKNIKFFGVDLVEPGQNFNLADFVSYSQKIIQDSIKDNVPLIIVGGTGLYLKAITSHLLNTHVPPNQALRRDLETLDLSSLQARLSRLNPDKYASLNHSDLNNPRRLIRAIEISLSPQITPALSREGVGEGFLSPPTFHWIGLRQDKGIQKSKIRQRVLDRLDSGAVEEVKNLLKKYPNHSLPIYTGLGVREIIRFINNEISLNNLVDLWTNSEVDYARRQMVWFNKQPDIFWYDKTKVDESLVEKLAKIYT